MEANLQKRIHKELVEAMRAKDEFRTGVFRMAIASFEKRAIEKRSKDGSDALSPEDEIGVIRSEVKRRRESKELFEKGGRQDLAEKEAREIEILSEYLPPEISIEEIERTVRDAITSTGATTQKDFGTVMKEAMKTLKGRADGAAVGAVIREILTL